MNVADVTATLDDGNPVTLGELSRENAIALIFLRHFGCIFCRYQVAQLRGESELPVYFVCQESWQEAAKFKQRMRSPHRFLSDPNRELYRKFGMPEGSTRQFLNLRTLARAGEAMVHGSFQGVPTSNPAQLGGMAIIAKGGETKQIRAAQDAGDIVTATQLRGFLQEEIAIRRED